MTACNSSTEWVTRVASCGERSRAMTPCRSKPTAKTRWMILVVQITGDAFPINDQGPVPRVASCGGQGQGDRGVVGEVADQVKILVAERWGGGVAGHHDDTQGLLFGSERHHDCGPLSDIGERRYWTAKRLDDQGFAGPKHLAGGGTFDRNLLSENVRGAHAD